MEIKSRGKRFILDAIKIKGEQGQEHRLISDWRPRTWRMGNRLLSSVGKNGSGLRVRKNRSTEMQRCSMRACAT